MIHPVFKLRRDSDMRFQKKSIMAILFFSVFGALYGILTNSIFEKMVSALWTPLAIALYFLVFAILLCLLIVFIVKKLGHDNERATMIRDMAIVLLAIFVSSMLFEFLYEIGLNVEMSEPDSYILMIDDSGSMADNDPNTQREKAIATLVRDKSENFKYSIYVFSDDVKKIRDMQPKSYGFTGIDLNTEGGTAMFGCLKKVLSDISTGNLKTDSATRVILLSDGYAGDEPLFKHKLLKEYIENDIVISTIGLGTGVDTSTMKHIAEYTGGVYIHVDDASMLDTAMLDASIQTSTRNLLGFRGFCKTDVLHAVLRVLFLLVIIALIYILKIYSYGKYYNPNLILSGILCVIAGFLPEIALQTFSWNDNLVRVVFCVLISITLVEYIEPKRDRYRRTSFDETGENEFDLSGSSELANEHKIEDRNVSSLR